jgi:hypothetical protein
MIIDVAVGAFFRAGYGAVVARSWWDRESRRLTDQMRQRLAELAERGADGRVVGRERAARAVDRAVVALASSSIVDKVVDVQVERLLARLAEEPERLREPWRAVPRAGARYSPANRRVPGPAEAPRPQFIRAE